MKRNKFNLSHEKKLSLEHGWLTPNLLLDVLPGDDMRLKTETFVRVAPMIAPLMHRVTVRQYYFYVPLRLVWDDAEEFFTRGRKHVSTVTVPRVAITEANKANFAKGTLADYFGIPVTDGKTINGTHWVSALPFRCYQLIYNEIFRNEDVMEEVEFFTNSADSVDSGEIAQLTAMRRRNWDKDYFTNIKAQAVLNPEINGYVPIQRVDDLNEGSKIVQDSGALPSAASNLSTNTAGQLLHTPDGIMRLENSNLGFDIDDLRRVSALQRWMELIIRVGYKFRDYLKGVWGVKASDARIDFPEYIGGASEPLRISEVLNTSDTVNAPQGDMAGHGIASGNTPNIKRTFEEQGYIIGIMCVIPKPAYTQGMESHWTKFDHMDWANPMLANLGATYFNLGEIYHDYEVPFDSAQENFGYKQIYSEYKSKADQVHGEFRDTLSYWHMGRNFLTKPTLDAGYFRCEPKSSVFAVESGHHYFAQIFHNISMRRALPYFPNMKID